MNESTLKRALSIKLSSSSHEEEEEDENDSELVDISFLKKPDQVYQPAVNSDLVVQEVDHEHNG